MKKIILATNNKNKILEFKYLFHRSKYSIIPQIQHNVNSIEETGSTFIENAILKAVHAFKITKLPTISDDSGLTVNSLKNEPGIYSSRYAGIQSNDYKNIKKLLYKMINIPYHQRIAHFHCVLVYLKNLNQNPIIIHKKWSGIINTSYIPSEKSFGFGYDPIFYIPTLKKTVSEMKIEEKLNFSHRAKALKNLLRILD